MIIKASATLRQNYNDIVSLCKEKLKKTECVDKRAFAGRSLWYFGKGHRGD